MDHSFYVPGKTNYIKIISSTNVNVKKENIKRKGVIRLSENNKGLKLLYKMGWDGRSRFGIHCGFFENPIESVNPKIGYYRFGL